MSEDTEFVNEIDAKNPKKQCAICESRHNACDKYPCDMCRTITDELDNFSQDDFTGTCTWCGEDFDQDSLTRTDIGYLCEHCIAAIRSRGESLTVYQEDRL